MYGFCSLDVVRTDLKTDLLTTIFYNEESFDKRMWFPFPCDYYDKLGNGIGTAPDEGIREKVDLSKDCVLVLPWDHNRMRDNIKNIYKKGFKIEKSDHLAYYFTHIDVCYAYKGNHSIASGIRYKNGFIEAIKCDVSKLFNHVYTDGLSWYNSHNDNKLDKVFDFRIAILYEIAKIKYKIQKNSL